MVLKVPRGMLGTLSSHDPIAGLWEDQQGERAMRVVEVQAGRGGVARGHGSAQEVPLWTTSEKPTVHHPTLRSWRILHETKGEVDDTRR
jgi:hypothetical protein